MLHEQLAQIPCYLPAHDCGCVEVPYVQLTEEKKTDKTEHGSCNMPSSQVCGSQG